MSTFFNPGEQKQIPVNPFNVSSLRNALLTQQQPQKANTFMAEGWALDFLQQQSQVSDAVMQQQTPIVREDPAIGHHIEQEINRPNARTSNLSMRICI
jgi:hypothetical protein